MAKSVLSSFVSGTRQVLFVQLFISVGAIGLAGWTLAVTNDLIRERDSLNERVIQLEEELARNDIVPPPTALTPETTAPPQDAYPPSSPEPTPLDETGKPVEEPTPPTEPNPGQRGEVDVQRPTQAEDRAFNPATIFAAAPPLRTVVLHVRAQEDAPMAQRIAREMMAAGDVRVGVDVMPPRDPRDSGYAYFDGRQNRAASLIAQTFNDSARRYEVAPWAVQLRGVALPAQGEYTPDRMDIVLPPLPRQRAPVTNDQRTILRERAVATPN
jgi:hypothetical protein